MESITNNLGRYKELGQTPKESSKEREIKWEFEQLGKEMVAHWGKDSGRRVFPLFYNPKYNVDVIRDAWFTYLKTTQTSFAYFMGILNRKAGIKKKQL